jgi:hypothetical protein
MPRLTDTQLIILSAASKRDDRGVELPANIEMLPSSSETRTTPTRGALLRVRSRYLPLPLGERVKHRAGISERASFSSPFSSWLPCCLLS